MAVIKDITGELRPFLELIADDIPECREVGTAWRFSDDRIDVRITFEIGGKELICCLREEADAFLGDSASILNRIRQQVEAWKYVGPPYKVIATDKEYEARFTPEQRRRMAEVFGA